MLTVAIPTFNGAPRLAKVLEHLLAQVVPEGDAWEVLVVNNNSNDNTAEVLRELQQEWAQTDLGTRVAFRCCFEPRSGLAFARQRAIAEAQGDWVGFIDDDNWPDPHWVSAAIAFAQDNPHLGAFGSHIQARYEVDPPANFHQIEAFLAIRDHGEEQSPFNPDQLQLPPGAGMVVHRQRWLAHVPEELPLIGRVGKSWICGEDSAVLLYLHLAGYGIAYNPKMLIQHCIPAHRLQRDYLLPMAYGIGLATCQLRFINLQGLERGKIAARTLLGGTKRLLSLWQEQGQNLGEDLNHSFLFCFFLGGALSPLIALFPQWASALSFDRIHSLLQLWPLSLSLSLPTTQPKLSPAPSNLS